MLALMERVLERNMLGVFVSGHDNYTFCQMSGEKDTSVATKKQKFVGQDTLFALLPTGGRVLPSGIRGKNEVSGKKQLVDIKR